MDLRIADYEVKTISKLIDTMNDLKFQFGTSSRGDNFIFRGVKDTNYSLIPNVFREYEGKVKVRSDTENNFVSGRIYLAAESEILASFSKNARTYLPPSLHDEDFLLLQYAQHYGVPTRLLDFTANPLVALYFSCNGGAEKDGAIWVISIEPFQRWSFREPAGSDPAIEPFIRYSREELINHIMEEVIDVTEFDEDYIKKQRPVFFIPPYIDLRMSAQESRFLVWGSWHDPLNEMVDTNNFMKPIAGVRFETFDDQSFLLKITIPGSSKNSLLKELDLLGVNEKSIYPGLDGIGRYIKDRYRTDYDSGSWV